MENKNLELLKIKVEFDFSDSTIREFENANHYSYYKKWELVSCVGRSIFFDRNKHEWNDVLKSVLEYEINAAIPKNIQNSENNMFYLTIKTTYPGSWIIEAIGLISANPDVFLLVYVHLKEIVSLIDSLKSQINKKLNLKWEKIREENGIKIKGESYQSIEIKKFSLDFNSTINS